MDSSARPRVTMDGNPWFRALLILLVFIAALFLGSQVWALATNFADIITLFFLAWLVAFILKPLSNLASRYLNLPRAAAVVVVYLGLTLSLVVMGIVLVPLIVVQLVQLGANLPNYVAQIPDLVASLQGSLAQHNIDVDLSEIYRPQDLSSQIERLSTLLIQNTIALATGVASAMFNIVIALILSFYIMLDSPSISRFALSLVPERRQEEAQFLLASIDRTFGGFLRGQLIQAVIYGAGTAVVMWMGGLNYILTASLFAAAVMVIPFFGPLLAILPPLVIAIYQGTTAQFLFVLIALIVLQQVVTNIIAPKVMSEAVGLHPLLVFLAILAGAKIAGLAGAIFGVPVLAVINAMVLLFYRRSSLGRRQEAAESPPVGAAEPAIPSLAGAPKLVRSNGWERLCQALASVRQRLFARLW